MFKFIMSIGDWSGDGHREHEDFLISSNAPVEQVREAHFKIKEATGIDIQEICNDDEDDCIPKDVLAALAELGFTPKDDEGYMYPGDMARLWLFLLQKADPSLQLEIVKDDTATLHFYGFDEKGRSFGGVGYGLF